MRAGAEGEVLVVMALGDRDLAQTCTTIASLAEAGCHVVAVTSGVDLDLTARALEAGAAEVVTAKRPLTELVDLLRAQDEKPSTLSGRLSAGGAAHDHDLREVDHALDLLLLSTLTGSEDAVLRDLMRGHSPEEISLDRFVALSTVRSQIRSILRKLGVSSQLAAVALAFRSDRQEVRELA